MMNLPFDLNRVRSMIDETNLSSNARQFMNDLQHIQEQRRIKENNSSPNQQFNLKQLMLMMKGKDLILTYD
jgi:UDP-galactopyranose mutase